jgi:UDP-N-acetylglucosamine--N-acetylmuramyl-(pentapeptide) pyrophosphoryl-undecaprenol N-acetylglucosamine transferase
MTMVVWPQRANVDVGVTSGVSGRSMDVKRAKTVRVVMAGGGTGGHLYPGLAVAEALRARVAGMNGELELVWAATPRSVDQRLLSKFGERYIQQPVQPLVKSLKKAMSFLKAWRQTCAYWSRRFSMEQVDCVVALGGYAAGPAAYVAWKRGIPVVLLNPDALPGLANRFLLKRSTTVVTQWPLGARYRKMLKATVKPLGCPIRAELVEDTPTRDEAAAKFQLDPNKKTLVVTGASLGAKTINEAMLVLLNDAETRQAFESSWQILHLAGLEQAAAVKAAYAAYPHVTATVVDYCDDMASVWALADVAIARAGASTCAELTACGVPSVLLPYPFHKDMHQRANALELVRAGAAIIVEDEKDAARNATAIKTVLHSLLYDDTLRDRMADAAVLSGKPHAADEIAKEILALAGQS